MVKKFIVSPSRRESKSSAIWDWVDQRWSKQPTHSSSGKVIVVWRPMLKILRAISLLILRENSKTKLRNGFWNAAAQNILPRPNRPWIGKSQMQTTGFNPRASLRCSNLPRKSSFLNSQNKSALSKLAASTCLKRRGLTILPFYSAFSNETSKLFPWSLKRWVLTSCREVRLSSMMRT